MIVVVSDTSPIRALAHLELLPVLQSLFDRIVVPPAVVDELRRPPSRLTVVNVEEHGFLEIQEPSDKSEVARLQHELDPGESEALALAVEIKASAILIDEQAGRTLSARLGLLPLGTLGILLRAKRSGLVRDIAPLLQQLTDELGFFISGELHREILRQAGE